MTLFQAPAEVSGLLWGDTRLGCSMSPSPSLSPSPSSFPETDDGSVLLPFLLTLAQTAFIILLGYLGHKLEVVSDVELKGVKKFCGAIALPAEFFLSVANVRWGSIDFRILGGLMLGKSIVFCLAAVYCKIRKMWHVSSSDEADVSVLGLFCIFTTKSNDFALGVPLIVSLMGTKYANYIYLFAPFQLLVLNVLGFVCLELGLENKMAYSQRENGEEARYVGPLALARRVLWNVITTPTVMAVLVGAITNAVLTSTHVAYGKAPSEPLLPGGINTAIETVANGFAPTALFTIGSGLSKWFQSSSKEKVPGAEGEKTLNGYDILDGTVLLFFKSVVLAISTSKAIDLLTNGDDPTASDFGLIYGMVPVAPTLYIFANIYGVKERFMAVMVNASLFVAVPLLLVAVISLQSVKALEPEELVELDRTTSYYGSLFACIFSAPPLVGIFFSGRWLKSPWDFFLVMALSMFVGSLQCFLCVSGDRTGLVHGSASAITNFFFHGLYYTHAAAVTIYLLTKQSTWGKNNPLRLRTFCHFFSLLASATTALVMSAMPSVEGAPGFQACDVGPMMRTNKNIAQVGGAFLLITAIVSLAGLVLLAKREKGNLHRTIPKPASREGSVGIFIECLSRYRFYIFLVASFCSCTLQAFVLLFLEKASTAQVEISLFSKIIGQGEGFLLLAIFTLRPGVFTYLKLVFSKIVNCCEPNDIDVLTQHYTSHTSQRYKGSVSPRAPPRFYSVNPEASLKVQLMSEEEEKMEADAQYSGESRQLCGGQTFLPGQRPRRHADRQ